MNISRTEVNDVMETVRKSYPRYSYDDRQGFHCGPIEFEYLPGEKAKLSRDEAVIGIKEDISRMARSLLLKVKKHDGTWEVLDVLRDVEG